MGPELLDPDQFGFKDGLPTKKSDCYALGMVIYEVLSGKAPFAPDGVVIVIRKVTNGERPERPQGVEGALFTDHLWDTLRLCWAHQPEGRPTIETVLERLEWITMAWSPLPPIDGGLGGQPREAGPNEPARSSLSTLSSRKRRRAGSGPGIHPSPDPQRRPDALMTAIFFPVRDPPRAVNSRGFRFSPSTAVTLPPTVRKRRRSGSDLEMPSSSDSQWTSDTLVPPAGLKANVVRNLVNRACLP